MYKNYIVEDIGTQSYADILDWDNFENLYIKAINQILDIQTFSVDNLENYSCDELYNEMELMKKWYFESLLRKSLKPQQNDVIKKTFDSIVENISTQPQNIFVHKDFLSQNISLNGDELLLKRPTNPKKGILLYDLATILNDYHLNFERDDLIKLVLYFRDKKSLKVTDTEFIKWFDFISLQINMKLLGVFSHSFVCDGNKDVLKYIPIILETVFDLSNKYEETKQFTQLLKEL